jgi:hypothetical protein|tara:strand:- start:4252 stop:5346 length:1095 start_codon:yes stop_codon:yes gene_type:complete
MLPITFSQLQSLSFKNLLKIFIWVIFRNFQFKNKKKYSSVFFVDKVIDNNLYLPVDIEIVEDINENTLIIINKFKIIKLLKNIFRLNSIRLADKDFFLTSEASTSMRLWYFDFSSKEERTVYDSISTRNLDRLVSKFNNEKICILGTGPSFESALKIFQENDNNIITCNSAIYQNNLWDEKKHILCFADPVYHFGKSEEASRFKSEVIKKFNNKKFFIVCPIECFPILRDSWGIDENFIIGLSRNSESQYRNIDNEFIDIKKTSNILTEYMLPLSSMLSKSIFLGGFDGREKNEKNFWKYSKTTNQDIYEHQIQHPSFFKDRDMKKYYYSHLSILEKQIDDLEKKGFIIKNVTSSNIQFLNDRK